MSTGLKKHLEEEHDKTGFGTSDLNLKLLHLEAHIEKMAVRLEFATPVSHRQEVKRNHVATEELWNAFRTFETTVTNTIHRKRR